MKKFNELNLEEILKILNNKEPFAFEATRNDFNFEIEDFEKKLVPFNNELPFPLSIMNNLKELTNFIVMDAIGQIHLTLMEKIIFFTEINGGSIFCQRLDSSGNNWKVMILFNKKIN